MTEMESVLVQLGELVFVEMDDIKSVTQETKTSFVILTNDGKEFIIEIRQK